MAASRVAPCGSWASPLTARAVATASAAIGDARAFGGRLLWTETRPDEGGRIALLERDGADGAVELVPARFSVRTRVHEYGGIAYLAAGSRLLFCNDADQRLYAAEAGWPPAPLTPAGLRYADGDATADGRRVVLVREDHRGAGEPVNALVAIDPTRPSEGTMLFAGSDFVAAPRISPDGRRLAFLSWNHPSMPWDGTHLHVGRLTDGGLADLSLVAGAGDESVIEPAWDADGTLYFLSDRSGWWNLYRYRDGRVEAVTSLEAELGGPPWQLGQSTWALAGGGRAIASICRGARDELAVIDLATGAARPLPLPFVAFSSVGILDAGAAYAIAAAEDEPPALIEVDLASGRHTPLRRPAAAPPLPREFISRAEPIEFPTPSTDGAARSAFAFFYPPRNPGFAVSAAEKPPLLVEVHGGPTARRAPNLNLQRQFWTTRGVAVVDVNYGGSSGFGRAYRERLRGNWGVVDLADAVAAAKYLVDAGRVDPRRVVIRGGSAGGFTVLSALAFTDVFAAGVNYYGIADLEALAADTHKFESRYLDGLVAPLPQGRGTYRARSPIFHLQRMNAALITFQGAEDRAVPPAQSRALVAAARSRGLPVAYIEFEGEQHGLRQAGNIVRALEAEVYFLGRVLGFIPADPVPAVAIDNLPA